MISYPMPFISPCVMPATIGFLSIVLIWSGEQQVPFSVVKLMKLLNDIALMYYLYRLRYDAQEVIGWESQNIYTTRLTGVSGSLDEALSLWKEAPLAS
jgi:hypothetical protein